MQNNPNATERQGLGTPSADAVAAAAHKIEDRLTALALGAPMALSMAYEKAGTAAGDWDLDTARAVFAAVATYGSSVAEYIIQNGKGRTADEITTLRRVFLYRLAETALRDVGPASLWWSDSDDIATHRSGDTWHRSRLITAIATAPDPIAYDRTDRVVQLLTRLKVLNSRNGFHHAG